jgi:type IV pilus assembly protein PilC
MNRWVRRLKYPGYVAAVLAGAAGVVGCFAVSPPLGTGLIALLAVGGGVCGYAYVTYRQGRQREVLHLLTAAVTANAPIPPLLDAYLAERPKRYFWWAVFLVAAGLLTLAVPGLVLVWWWLWRRRFDRQLDLLADRLDAGVPFAEALRSVTGVVSGEALLAAEVGGATGRLPECLARADRERTASAWLELVPRLLYPLFLVWVLFSVTTFLMVAIMPKFKRIFDEFGMTLPAVTRGLIEAWSNSELVGPLVGLGFLGAGTLVALVAFSPVARWYVPGAGRLYRWEVQGQVLRLLGTLTDVGTPAPAALRLLADAEGFPPPAATRLTAAAAAAERGEPLADALRANGLVPSGMAPLIAAGERAGTLAWVLSELGDHLAARSVRLVRRASLVVAPACVAVVGAGVGFVALAGFLPLITILTGLAHE